MGIKIWYLGTTFVVASYLLNFSHEVQLAGAILMVIGNVLIFMDK